MRRRATAAPFRIDQAANRMMPTRISEVTMTASRVARAQSKSARSRPTLVETTAPPSRNAGMPTALR
jgi:hypothetical protein